MTDPATLERFSTLLSNDYVPSVGGWVQVDLNAGVSTVLNAFNTLGPQSVELFLIDQAGQVSEARLPRTGSHLVTGADIGPDGRLYLVLREYSLLFGVSIRVMRYRLGPDGLPLPDSAETLAAFETASGIDNMEGIALDRGPGGDIRLWLISDDNFQFPQRTLLVRFDVLQ